MTPITDLPRHATTEQLLDWCVEELTKYDMVKNMTEKKKWFRREFWRGHNSLVCGLLETYLEPQEIKKRLGNKVYEKYFGR